jgi:hypothetical protein
MTPNARTAQPKAYCTFAKCADCGDDKLFVTVTDGVADRTLCDDCEAFRAAGVGGPLSWVLTEQCDEATEVLGVFSTKNKADKAKADVEAKREYTDGLSVRAFPTDLLKVGA